MTKPRGPKMKVSLKVGCLPYAVGKQPSIPSINLGRKWTLSGRWIYLYLNCFRYMNISDNFNFETVAVCLCDQHEHLPSKMLDEVFNLSADKLFGLVFTSSRLSRKHLKCIKADGKNRARIGDLRARLYRLTKLTLSVVFNREHLLGK